MTVNPTRSPFWLWFAQGNTWVQLEGVLPGVPVTPTRPQSLFVTLGNTVYAQVAARENRVWALSYMFEDFEAGRWLDRASRNASEVWLYDQTAGLQNMLDDRTTEGTLDAATLIVAEGISFKAFKAGDGFTRKLRDGVTYHLAFTTTAAAGATVGTYNLGAGPVNIVAPSGSGARRGSVNITPGANVDVTVIWTAANKTTAAQFTESSVSVPWVEGQGTPCQVLVTKGGRTAQQAFSDRPALQDFAYTLQEVG